MAEIPDAMLAKLGQLVKVFADRSQDARGENNDVAIAWAVAAGDLAWVLTIDSKVNE